MESYSQEIAHIIEKMPRNKIFKSQDLYYQYFNSIPEKTYYKVLERLVKKEQIAHLSKGLYYRVKKTSFGNVPISENEIIEFYFQNDQGLEIGYRLYNKKGLTTQVSKQVEILTNNLVGNQKSVLNVKVYNIYFEMTKKRKEVIEMLEILQNYNQIEDINKKSFVRYVDGWTQCYSQVDVDYVLQYRKYKKSTIAFLESILSYNRVENTLNKYLSPLSEYSIPNVRELYEASL